MLLVPVTVEIDDAVTVLEMVLVVIDDTVNGFKSDSSDRTRRSDSSSKSHAPNI